MKEALKIYFTRPQIIFYSVLGVSLLTYIISKGLIFKYWYLSISILLLSPFIEYFAHKYFLHLPKIGKKDNLYNKFMDHIHYYHHVNPKDVNFIFAQIWLTLPVLLFDITAIYLITWSVDKTLVFITSMMFYYLFYEWSHFVAHANYTPKNKYGKYMKKYHVLHHYKNENFWYGITSPMADIIFGKFRTADSVHKSDTVKTLG